MYVYIVEQGGYDSYPEIDVFASHKLARYFALQAVERNQIEQNSRMLPRNWERDKDDEDRWSNDFDFITIKKYPVSL